MIVAFFDLLHGSVPVVFSLSIPHGRGHQKPYLPRSKNFAP
jgi:hypothetical protein